MPVTVNDHRIEDETIRSEAQRLTPDLRRECHWMDETALKLHAEDLAKQRLVEQRLLLDAAREQAAAPEQEDVEKALQRLFERHGGQAAFLEKFKLKSSQIPQVKDDLAEDLRFKAYLAQIEAGAEPVDEAAVAARYERDKNHFKTPERFEASHIVFHTNNGQDPAEAKAKAEAALARLEAGEPFEKLADEASDCPGKGGSLGWFPRGQMVEEFEQELDKLEPGERSGVFATPFGYHIARLDSREPEGVQPLEAVSDQLKASLESERREACFEAVINELKAKAAIES